VWPRLADRVQVMLHLLQEQKRRQASGEPDALCRLPMRPDHGHKLLQDLKDPRTNLVSHAPSLAPATVPPRAREGGPVFLIKGTLNQVARAPHRNGAVTARLFF